MKILDITQTMEVQGVPYVEGQAVGFDDVLAEGLVAAGLATPSEATSFTVHTARPE
jgi:hypothetical protein